MRQPETAQLTHHGDADESVPGATAAVRARSEPPRWLVAAAVGAAGAVLCAGGAGLLLADLGRYTPGFAFVVGASLFVGFVALVVRALPPWPTTPRSAHVVAAVGIGVVVAAGAWNCANASEHVLINRDAGAYVNAGRWIARNGTLEVHPKAGPFRGPNALQFPDIGMLKRKAPLRLQFHGSHLLPALLAEAHALAGDRGLFTLPPLLGALALLEFFVLAWRLFRQPMFALAAVLALAVMLPEVSFARDAYSEIPTQIFLFAALALLVDKRLAPNWRLALGAGLLLGGIQATRIDAPLHLIGIAPLIAIAWLRAVTKQERRHVRTASIALAIGLVPGCLLGFTDLLARSSRYWHGQWRHERWLLVLAGASVVSSLILVVIWPRVRAPMARLHWNKISWGAFAFVLVAGLGAWFVRPEIQHLHKVFLNTLQEDGRLVYRFGVAKYEPSIWWMSWYLGPCTVFCAIAGGAFLARDFLLGRRLYALAPAFVLVPPTILYLWRANAFADHVWVTRRYLNGAFPLFVLLALGLAAALWLIDAIPVRIAAALVAIGAVALPLFTTLPVRSAREQGGFLTAVHDLCRAIGPKANVAIVASLTSMASDDVREEWMPQTLRSFCGANVGTLYVGTSRRDLQALAGKVEQRNKSLFLVASGASVISQLAPEARVVFDTTATNRSLLEQTFTDAPSSYETQTLPLVVARLPNDFAH